MEINFDALRKMIGKDVTVLGDALGRVLKTYDVYDEDRNQIVDSFDSLAYYVEMLANLEFKEDDVFDGLEDVNIKRLENENE